jgi:hypothetical protein
MLHSNHEFRILDVRGASRVEQVLNLRRVLRRAISDRYPENGMARVSLNITVTGLLPFWPSWTTGKRRGF